MTALTLHSRVRFRHPFEVFGLEGVQPAGSYTIEMRRWPWWLNLLNRPRPSSVSMRICQNHGLKGELHLIEICQKDLGEALRRDQETSVR